MFRGEIGKGSPGCCSSRRKRSHEPAPTLLFARLTRRTKRLSLWDQRSPIPWLHIVEVVGDAAAGRGLSKLGILGTRFLMEGNLYRDVLSKRGIDAVIPADERQGEDQCLIFDELVKGVLQSSTREYFRGVVARSGE